jgi:ATP-dependent Clp protease adaptor protein ClpS
MATTAEVQTAPSAPTIEAPEKVAAKPSDQKATSTRTGEATEKLPPYNVVLLNDDDHTYDYVIAMGIKLFNLPLTKAIEAAVTVDKVGRAVMCTTHKEHAELKREQVHSFGRDVLVASCAGSMSAVIEPATVT